ncbi:HAD family hydrolase [Clostridium botulinum]|uniref:HAD family hydrolase n=1 Tax=Clostridium botulinum TaxID=1491 RepID=UPI0006A4D951|nr:HAD-IA family hydrolase [Clostridium botulinum]KOC31910.1 hydrolase [Clostridium botulinum]
MIKALIFDLDDTLYNERNYVFGAFKEVCKYLSYKYSLNELQLYDDILNVFNKEGRGKIFNIICDRYNLNEDIKKLVHIYRNSKPKLDLYDDAKKILEWCRNSGFKLGIITDGCSKVQWNKIKSLKLENIVDKIIVTDDFGKEYWKPHKRSYVEISKYLNVEYKECAYIGDNSNKDFVGCKELGINTVRIIRKQGDHMQTFLSKEYEADKNINNLTEIKEIIKE